MAWERGYRAEPQCLASGPDGMTMRAKKGLDGAFSVSSMSSRGHSIHPVLCIVSPEGITDRINHSRDILS